MFSDFFSLEYFYGSKLKVNDSLTRTNEVTIPIAGIEIKFLQKSIYMLKSVQDNIAYFDTKQTYKMLQSSGNFTIVSSGIGQGECTFDIANKHILLSKLHSEIVASIDLNNGGFVEIKINDISESNTVITKNNL